MSDQIAVIGGRAGEPLPQDRADSGDISPLALTTTKRGMARDARDRYEQDVAREMPRRAGVARNPSSIPAHPMPLPTDRLCIYDPTKGGWTLGPPLPRAKLTAAVVDGPFVITAGGYIDGGALTDVDVFDLRAGTWRAAKPLGRPTSAHSMVLLDHYLFLFGDYNEPGELLSYDLRTETSEVFTLGYKPARHTAAVTYDRKIYVMGGRAMRITAPLKTIQVFALQKDVTTAKKD